MSSQQIDMILDLKTVERLSARFNRCFETLEASDDLFSSDAFFDRSDHGGRRLLQRRMGRGVAGPPRGRGPNAPTLTRTESPAYDGRIFNSVAGPWSERSRP